MRRVQCTFSVALRFVIVWSLNNLIFDNNFRWYLPVGLLVTRHSLNNPTVFSETAARKLVSDLFEFSHPPTGIFTRQMLSVSLPLTHINIIDCTQNRTQDTNFNSSFFFSIQLLIFLPSRHDKEWVFRSLVWFCRWICLDAERLM